MADQQDRPDEEPQSTPPPRVDASPAGRDPVPPAAEPPEPSRRRPRRARRRPQPPPAKTPPAKAAKKTPAKKRRPRLRRRPPPRRKPPQEGPAKKAPAKKAPQRPKLADTNGDLASAAKEAAAKAKAAVATREQPGIRTCAGAVDRTRAVAAADRRGHRGRCAGHPGGAARPPRLRRGLNRIRLDPHATSGSIVAPWTPRPSAR